MTHSHDFLSGALALIGNGYNIIPIKAGEKRPGIDDWQNMRATEDTARMWADNGFEDGGIGILTERTPAIDLDIYDEKMAERMERWCLREFGPALVRVGRAPKRLLLFYCEHPFTKLMATYADTRGTKHKIEILGRGQQFVAQGIHPETKRPFAWTTKDTPFNMPADFLPILTVDQGRQVLAQFGEFAREEGWTFVSDNSTMGGGIEDDNALASMRPRLKITRAEVEHALQFVDGAEDYDRWIMVGMALHHQTRGHEAGLELWQEWSSQAHNYDAKACEMRWRKSFADIPTGHYATTFASVLKIANEAEKRAKSDEFNRLMNVMRNSTDEDEILGPVARELGRAISTDYQLDLAAKKMQDRLYELSEVRPRIEVCRKALTPKKERSESSNVPEWCDGWVYVTKADRFFHLSQKTLLTERAFNATFDREVLSPEDRVQGVAVPAARASAMALNVYNIPVVEHTVYLPGYDRQLEIDGRLVANTFDETTIPEARAPRTEEERDAIRTVERHFEVLFPHADERTLVLDYMAYNVQFPAEKIVWGIVMVGAEGGGKTFISKLMSRVLGNRNVGPVAASEIQDKYTGWAEGRKMNFVEEIRLQGQNRYEIIEKLKIYLSNEDAPIRKMHTDSYVVPNVTNYVMFTNHWDALPLSRGDRRYYVVATSFQTKEEIEDWEAQHPSYFTELYAAVSEHGEVLRHWLLTRTLSDKFQPKRRALDSHAKRLMRDVSESSDEHDALDQVLLNSTDPEVSELLVNADKLRDAISSDGGVAPYGRAFSTLLTKAGFVQIGRFNLSGEKSGKLTRFYSKRPSEFPRGGELEAIRRIIDAAKDPNDPFA